MTKEQIVEKLKDARAYQQTLQLKINSSNAKLKIVNDNIDALEIAEEALPE